jgi:hypothetical protein
MVVKINDQVQAVISPFHDTHPRMRCGESSFGFGLAASTSTTSCPISYVPLFTRPGPELVLVNNKTLFGIGVKISSMKLQTIMQSFICCH